MGRKLEDSLGYRLALTNYNEVTVAEISVVLQIWACLSLCAYSPPALFLPLVAASLVSFQFELNTPMLKI